jgi:hypothetical protein
MRLTGGGDAGMPPLARCLSSPDPSLHPSPHRQPHCPQHTAFHRQPQAPGHELTHSFSWFSPSPPQGAHPRKNPAPPLQVYTWPPHRPPLAIRTLKFPLAESPPSTETRKIARKKFRRALTPYPSLCHILTKTCQKPAMLDRPLTGHFALKCVIPVFTQKIAVNRGSIPIFHHKTR